MRRITVKLSDDVDLQLRHEAKRRGVTVFAPFEKHEHRHVPAVA